MSAAAIRGVVRRLGPSADPPPDADLVSAFAARRDADAFAALVARHGPTVFGVCRRVLGDAHDAEDAFQAVFFVLAQKVKAVRPPGAVGGWLYGVAVRTANKAKVAAARRRRREMIAALTEVSRERERPESSHELNELRATLDAELARLPETLRAAVVLCDLQGKTRAEAATELGCPAGTVAARLHRARKKLGDALSRRGLALPAAGLAAVLTPVAVSAAASRSAVTVALGSAPPAILALAREVTRNMSTNTHAIALGALTLLAGGLLAAGSLWPSDSPNPMPAPPPSLDVKVEQSRPGPWHETKVLDLDGRLAGSVVYSADGKTLFVGGTDGHVRAYDAATWKQLWEYKCDSRFAALALAPDGKSLAATFKDGVQFLDAATGKAGDILEQKGSAPIAVAYMPLDHNAPAPGPPSHKVISGNADGHYYKTWRTDPKNAATYETVSTRFGRQLADKYAVPLAADAESKWVLLADTLQGDTGKNELGAWSAWDWTAKSSYGEYRKIEGHKASVVSAAWSKNNKWFVTGDADGVVITWDPATFKEKSRLSLGGRVAAVAISADGKRFAAATARDIGGPGQGAYVEGVFVWPAANQPEKPAPISEHKAGAPFKGVASLAFAPDGKTLVSAFCNFDHLTKLGELTGKVRVFTMADEQPKPDKQPGYVSDVRYSPDGTRYAVAPGVTVHDAAGKTLYSVRGEAAGFSVDGKTLFVMGEKVLECDAATGKVLKEHPRPKPKWGWHLVAFAPDGKRFAAHFGFNVRVYDTATGFEPVQLDDQHEPGSAALPATVGKQLIWSPDGKQVVAVGVLIGEGKVGMAGWDVESGKRFYSFASDFEDGPRSVAFSKDSKSIAIGYEKRIDVWTGGLKPVKKLGEQGLVTALAFSKDGKQIAAGIRLPILHGGDKLPRVIGHKTEVRLIDIATDKVVKVFDGFEGVSHMAATKLPVTALAFSPDGKKLLAGTGIMNLTEIPADAPKTGEVKVFDLGDPPAKPEPPLAKPVKPGRLSISRMDRFEFLTPDGKADGTPPTHPHPALLGCGCLSSDTRWFAYTAHPGPQSPKDELEKGLHVFVRSLTDEKKLIAISLDVRYLCWAPNGLKLLAVEHPASERDNSQPDHWLVDPKTGKKERLSLPLGHVHDWSPDGNCFLVSIVDPKQNEARLSIVNRQDKTETTLQRMRYPCWLEMARFSPDGRTVLFGMPKDEKSEEWIKSLPRLYILDVHSKTKQELPDVPLNASITEVCWSPDGKRIAYKWRPIPSDIGKRVFREVKGDELQMETEEFVTVVDADGKNPKDIAVGKGPFLNSVILTGLDWR